MLTTAPALRPALDHQPNSMHQSETKRDNEHPPVQRSQPAQTPAAPEPVKCNTRPVDPLALTPNHLLAITLLLQGRSDAAVAKALGLSRATIYRWRTLHPCFIAELNRCRQDQYRETKEHLRTLLHRATRVLGQFLTHSDPDKRFRAAHALLLHLAPRNIAPPSTKSAPTSADEILHRTYRSYCPAASRAEHDEPLTAKQLQETRDFYIYNLNQADQSAPDDALPEPGETLALQDQ